MAKINNVQLTAKKIMNETDIERLERLRSEYKKFYEEPAKARPKVIVNVPPKNPPTWEDQLQDPLTMLNAQLDSISSHIQIGDDYMPAVRINFGTGQVAAAFGCELTIPENNLPAVKTHPLKNVKDVYDLEMPDLNAGWYPKLEQWNNIWLDNLPEGVVIQHPDIQSAFNTAHLLRGNDIFTDFYDAPEAVEHLLDLITDYMIEIMQRFNKMIGLQKGWFYDWGAFWKGAGRISNCSTTMISPELYKQHIFPRDKRFFKSIGGGRMHYCGSSTEVINEFFKTPGLSGLDCDCRFHDLWELAETAPSDFSLIFQEYGKPFPHTNRLLKGDWPEKRNIIVITEAETIEEGKKVYHDLVNSMPY